METLSHSHLIHLDEVAVFCKRMSILCVVVPNVLTYLLAYSGFRLTAFVL